jgi:hypothetical protein
MCALVSKNLEAGRNGREVSSNFLSLKVGKRNAGSEL